MLAFVKGASPDRCPLVASSAFVLNRRTPQSSSFDHVSRASTGACWSLSRRGNFDFGKTVEYRFPYKL